MNSSEKKQLKIAACKVRMGAIEGVFHAKSGHPGGSLSAADLYTYLYFQEMHIDPENPKDPDRDRFVLSKGHCAPGLYAALALRGYFPMDELKKLRHIGAMLQGHPDMKGTPGIDMSSGSLGQGISAACGMAKAGKMDGRDYHVYAVLGDGELAEGSVWEGVMAGGHFKLDNLTALVDRNRLQISGSTEDVMRQDSQETRWAAFGWNVISIPGNDMAAVDSALTLAKETKGKPTVIILNTTKGCGVSFMENLAVWHHKVMDDAQYETAMAEIAERKASL